MKNLRFFPARHAYRDFVYGEIVRDPVFHRHPFYRGLIEFIIDHRSPVFFEASEEYEYAHFAQYFNFAQIRDVYQNPVVRDLFFLHDFVHMVFDNPLQIAIYTRAYFSQLANFNEYVASNDTEILTYYRVPELRELTFPYPILYDLLSRRYPAPPSVRVLFDLRRRIIWDGDDAGLGDEPGAPEVFAFMRKFRENNRVWCETWYDHFPILKIDYSDKRLCLAIMGYDAFLERYQPEDDEVHYRENVLSNVRVALEMQGAPELPARFEHCEEALAALEGRVLMEGAARVFHAQYAKSKSG